MVRANPLTESQLTSCKDNDNAELQCICNATNANTLIPNCEACVAQYDTDTDDDDDDSVNDNDVREVLTRCNFTVQSTFNSASASSVASSIASSASAATTGNSVVVTRTSGTSVVTATVAPSQVSQAAAPAVTAAAGMGLGVLGFALGVL